MANKAKGDAKLIKQAKTEEQRRQKLAQMGIKSYVNFMDVQDKFEHYIIMGLSERNACALTGLHPMTIEKHKQAYPEYKERLSMLKDEFPGKAKYKHASILLNADSNLTDKERLNGLEWYLERSKHTKEDYTKSTHILNEVQNRDINPEVKAKIMDVFEVKEAEIVEDTPDNTGPLVPVED